MINSIHAGAWSMEFEDEIPLRVSWRAEADGGWLSLLEMAIHSRGWQPRPDNGETIEDPKPYGDEVVGLREIWATEVTTPEHLDQAAAFFMQVARLLHWTSERARVGLGADA